MFWTEWLFFGLKCCIFGFVNAPKGGVTRVWGRLNFRDMFKKFINFYKTSAPAAQLEISDEAKDKLYKKLRFQAFAAGTIAIASITSAVRA